MIVNCPWSGCRESEKNLTDKWTHSNVKKSHVVCDIRCTLLSSSLQFELQWQTVAKWYQCLVFVTLFKQWYLLILWLRTPWVRESIRMSAPVESVDVICVIFFDQCFYKTFHFHMHTSFPRPCCQHLKFNRVTTNNNSNNNRQRIK